MGSRPVALVTGANRGLGKETARQLLARGYRLVLTGRDLAKTEKAAEELRRGAPESAVHAVQLDVTNSGQAAATAAWVRENLGRLNVLVNNAGAIFASPDQPGVLEADPEVVLRTFDTNTVGALRVSQAMAPLLLESRGVIVNVSSGMGGITEMGPGYTGYRLSKLALNGVTRILHAELSGRGVRVNSVCPGWVQTEMGGPSATRGVAEGAASIVWAALIEPNGASGGFYRDGKALPW